MNLASTQTIDELFGLWRESRQDYTQFSNDGVLLENIWNSQKTKIAFLLKEPNDDFYANIRGNSYLPRDGNSRLFWRNINIWSYTVSQLLNNASVTFEDAKAHKEDLVGHIAYINLKKKNENRSVSEDADIQKYVENDWSFIAQQLRLVGPDVIFCCGTFRYIFPHVKIITLAEGVYRSEDKIIIDFFHPSCRKGYKVTFNILSKMLGNLSSGIKSVPDV